MALTKKEAFSKLVDESLYALRAQLLSAFPTESAQDQGTGEWTTGFSAAFTKVDRPSVSQLSARHSNGSADDANIAARADDDANGNQGKKPLEHAMTVDSEWSAGMGMERVETHASVLKSGLQHMGEQEARAVRHRLRLRLGALTAKKLVSGKSLHDACSALGLTRYTVEDMNELLNLLADYIDLTFEAPDMPTSGRRISESSAVSMFGFRESAVNSLGKPVWQWPQSGRDSTVSYHRSASLNAHVDAPARCHLNVVPAQPLMDLFLAQEGEVHRKVFGPRMLKQFQAMKEILLAGDTNRLVAELTFVRINDLAAPPEPMNLLLCLEPFVALIIIANGVMIGFQTDPAYRDWPHWLALEAGFASILLLEIAVRMYLQGRRAFFRGNELMWNLFDLFLGLTGLVDVIVQSVSSSGGDVFGTSLLRFCRLIRLVRIVKVFRLKVMKDLRLMVKGLIAGVKTLVMAFTLLLASEVGALEICWARLGMGFSHNSPQHMPPCQSLKAFRHL